MALLNPQVLALAGIHFPGEIHSIDAPNAGRDYGMACDAQPGLITVSNSGIPSMLTTYIDPKVISVLVAPMKAAEIIGEEQKGSWLTDTLTFQQVEHTGQVSSYGDYSANGSTGVNVNYPQRQTYHYQTVTQYGEREIERAGAARLDWISQLNIASALTLNKYQNLTYFFGVSGLQIYGLLNDPRLVSAISPATKAATGVTWAAGTALEIYQDVLNLFTQLQTQSVGTVEMDDEMTLVLSPVAAVNLNKISPYNVSVRASLRENFPNMTIITAPEYATAGGQLMQMIIKQKDGQKTAHCSFTEKMRAHPVITDLSSWKQKKSQGTAGAIIYRPVLIAQMLGL